MVNLTQRSVWLVPGTGIRHHGTPVEQDVPGTTPISITQTPGDTWQGSALTSVTSGGQTFQFMFWSVNFTSPPASASNKIIPLQPSQPLQFTGVIEIPNVPDIEVWAWYYLTGGGGQAPVYIDAFDELLGNFSNDLNIVNVVSDPSLTANANSQGVVPTSSSSEEILAVSSLMDGAVFDHWGWVWGDNESTTPSISVDAGNRMQLDASKNSGGYWLAFYRPPFIKFKESIKEKELIKEIIKEKESKELIKEKEYILDAKEAKDEIGIDHTKIQTDKWYQDIGKHGFKDVPDQGGFGPEVLPATQEAIRRLSDRLDRLERGIPGGKSFIRPEERPRVGRVAGKKKR